MQAARNYLISNITFISLADKEIGRRLPFMDLEDFKNPKIPSTLKFCAGAGSDAADFYSIFKEQYAPDGNKYSFSEYSGTNGVSAAVSVVNSVLAEECDIGILFDIDSMPLIRYCGGLAF